MTTVEGIISGMAEDGVERGETRRRRRRDKRKRKNRKREKLAYNLRWLLGGLAIGLPLLAVIIYTASRY
jgi:hypothetical protein